MRTQSFALHRVPGSFAECCCWAVFSGLRVEPSDLGGNKGRSLEKTGDFRSGGRKTRGKRETYVAITLRVRLNRKSRAAFNVRGSGGSTQPAIETGRGGKPEKGRVSNHTWRTGRMGAGAGLSQARWGVASEPGVGARTKPWPREGTGAVAAAPRRPGSHSGDDPRHATRPSFPRGLGCVREVALLALRKSKRLPTPEAFRPPQSLKKFISHHRGGGNRTQSRKPGRHAIRKSPGFDEFALVPYGNKPPPPHTHTHFSLCFASEFLRDLLLPSAVREQTAEP